MALFDLPLEQLRTYLPSREESSDFDSFWEETLTQARNFPLNATFEPVDYGLRTIDIFDVTFNGDGGHPIKAWLLLPKERSDHLPCIVQYVGYGSGRGFPTNWLVWSSAGYAHLIMDTRGQGSMWDKGDTPDFEVDSSNPQYPGFMTRGILRPQTYYYRRVFTDAVRAVEAAQTHSDVDSDRIAVTGRSQGGGIAIAVSALEPSIKLVMADVPFLCHFRRATEITDADPYQEISRFCATHRDKVELVFATLSYFDGVNFATRAHSQGLFSVALMDEICPPSTVFAAYNYFSGPKDIRIWPYNRHEGGGEYQILEKLKVVHDLWGSSE